MHYTTDILALYNTLFDQTYQRLKKEAGVWDQIGRGADWIRRVAAKPSYVRNVEQQLGTKGQALDDAVHRLGLAEADVAHFKRLAEQGNIAKNPEMGHVGRAAALGALGLGGVAVPGAYFAGKHQGEEGKTRTRNLAFGAGAAAGIAAPHFVRGIGQLAHHAGQTGLFPELQDYSGSYMGGGY